MRSAIQLYTLRDLDVPLPRLLDEVGRTGLDGVEFAGLGDSHPTDVAARLESTGLAVAGAHLSVEALEGTFDDVVRTYRVLDCDTVVIPYLDDSHFTSESAVDRTASRLSALAERFADEGFGLCYHNHDHEFVDIGGRTAFDLLVDRMDERVGIELDLGWVAAAGYDPIETLSGLSGRAPLVHLKDVDVSTSTPVELGDGDLDLAGCVTAARRAGVEWLIYEHDEPTDPAASLHHGADVLARLV